MKISGVIHFGGLNATGARILHEYERQSIQGVRFTFGPSPDLATVRWDSIQQLSIITHMAELVAGRQDSPDGPNFQLPNS